MLSALSAPGAPARTSPGVPGPFGAFRSRPVLQRALLALAAAGLLALVVAEGADTGFVPTAAATVVTGVLSLSALVVRPELLARRALLAAGASAVLSVVSANLAQRPEHTPGVVELCALLVLVTRTIRHERLLTAAALVICVSLAVGLEPLRVGGTTGEQLSLIASALLLLLGTAVLAGLCLRLLDRLRARERRSIREAQRLEYARELHDFVAHHVTAIVAQTKAARFATAQGREQDPAELDRMLEGIENAASQSLSSMRGMVSVLRGGAQPGTLPGDAAEAAGPAEPADRADRAAAKDHGLAEVLERAVAELATATPPSVRVEVAPRLTGLRLPSGLVDVAYSVVREGLTNARRHAPGATLVTVAAGPGPGGPYGLEITVTDDGEDTATENLPLPESLPLPGSLPRPDGHPSPGRLPSTRGGFGLTGLAERVEGAGGRFTAGPLDEGTGWSVAAALPLPPAN